MDKAVWFYMHGEEKEGPVSHNDLQGMLERGEIDSQTKVWTESLNEWLPISEVEHFNMSALDEAPTVVIEKKVEYARETDPDHVRSRPWIRFWARMIDYSLFSLVIGFIIGFYNIEFGLLESNLGMLNIFLWVFIETVLVATWGTTPGKWMLKTFIRDKNHHRLTFSDALNRSFSVWWIGMAAGLPIISLITMIVAAVKLSNTGITSWDRRSEFRIFHNKVGSVRTLIVILYFICYAWFISYSQLKLMSMQ